MLNMQASTSDSQQGREWEQSAPPATGASNSSAAARCRNTGATLHLCWAEAEQGRPCAAVRGLHPPVRVPAHRGGSILRMLRSGGCQHRDHGQDAVTRPMEAESGVEETEQRGG